MSLWYVVRIRAGKLDQAMTEFGDLGIEAYAPKMRREHKHKVYKSWVTREFPLFTGYAFANMRYADFDRVRGMRNALSVLGISKDETRQAPPIPIGPDIIENLRACQARGDFDVLRPPPSATVKVGDRMRLNYGPLAGHYGSVTNVVGKRAIKAVVPLFGTLREVEIGLESIQLVA
jgi:transcription antitermination factor NusG